MPTHALMQPAPEALAQLDAARQALATVKTLPALKEIRDKAEALGRYTKQRQYSLEIQNTAAEIRLEAERRMGMLLKEMDRERGGRPKKKPLHDVMVSEVPPTLEDLGITPIQSHRWQQEAAVPEDVFQTYVAETREQGEELTSAAVLRQARPYLPPPKTRTPRWCIEDDVDAIYTLMERLWPHWKEPLERERIRSTIRGLLAMLDEDDSAREKGAKDDSC